MLIYLFILGGAGGGGSMWHVVSECFFFLFCFPIGLCTMKRDSVNNMCVCECVCVCVCVCVSCYDMHS